MGVHYCPYCEWVAVTGEGLREHMKGKHVKEITGRDFRDHREGEMSDISGRDEVEKGLFERLLEERAVKVQEMVAQIKELEQEMGVLKNIFDQWMLERGLLQVPVVPRAGEHYPRSEDIDPGFFRGLDGRGTARPGVDYTLQVEGGGSREA